MLLILKNTAFTEVELAEGVDCHPELNLILKEFKWVMKSYQAYC